LKNNVSVTIITSTLNCADDLIDTCKSIRNQSYKNFQWIVVDGDSVDGTINVIQSNQDLITNWISEPDNGIYDAWNKACKLIQGKWVIFLGAGDEFYSSTSLEIMLGKLIDLTDDIVIAYGNVYQFLDNKVIYEYGRVNLDQWDDYRPKLPAHQGIFHRATILDRPKPFDDTYKVVADSKFLLLALMRANAEYFDVDICKMLPGGVSSRDDRASIVKNEFLRLEKDIGYRIPFLRKSKYILTVLLKSLVLKVAGPGLIVIFRKLKRKMYFRS
jgi:glycosyltransferase involved in cell wall biosynthesis